MGKMESIRSCRFEHLGDHNHKKHVWHWFTWADTKFGWFRYFVELFKDSV